MITREEFQRVLQKAAGLKAVVIGDVMLDRYIYGTVDRISPEAPVPILLHTHDEVKAGGAANVAFNLAAWGCQTALIGLVGKDANAKGLQSLLAENNIQQCLIESASRPTSVKTRVVASSHHLLRIDEESTQYLEGAEEQEIVHQAERFLESYQPHLIILEDYNKGLLTESFIRTVKTFAKKHHIFLAVDPKEKNFFAYAGADLFKPNLREASQAARKSIQPAELQETTKTWRSTHDFHTVAITLGAQGIFIQNGDQGLQIKPERAIDVIDVCGAGDAVVCALTLGLMTGLSLEKIGTLANLTGAYVCSHSGVVPVNVEEIYQWI